MWWTGFYLHGAGKLPVIGIRSTGWHAQRRMAGWLAVDGGLEGAGGRVLRFAGVGDTVGRVISGGDDDD